MAESRQTALPRLDEPNERLASARKLAGFEDATAAARRFGWNENTYRSHENGQRGISKKMAIQYGRAFKVTPAWLLYGQETTIPPIDPELVNLWDNLTPEQRASILNLIRDLTRRVA